MSNAHKNECDYSVNFFFIIKDRKNNEINIVFHFKNLKYKKKICYKIRNNLKMFDILRISSKIHL